MLKDCFHINICQILRCLTEFQIVGFNILFGFLQDSNFLSSSYSFLLSLLKRKLLKCCNDSRRIGLSLFELLIHKKFMSSRKPYWGQCLWKCFEHYYYRQSWQDLESSDKVTTENVQNEFKPPTGMKVNLLNTYLVCTSTSKFGKL